MQERADEAVFSSAKNLSGSSRHLKAEASFVFPHLDDFEELARTRERRFLAATGLTFRRQI